MDLPIKNGGSFHNYGTVYQRVLRYTDTFTCPRRLLEATVDDRKKFHPTQIDCDRVRGDCDWATQMDSDVDFLSEALLIWWYASCVSWLLDLLWSSMGDSRIRESEDGMPELQKSIVLGKCKNHPKWWFFLKSRWLSDDSRLKCDFSSKVNSPPCSAKGLDVSFEVSRIRIASFERTAAWTQKPILLRCWKSWLSWQFYYQCISWGFNGALNLNLLHFFYTFGFQ